MVAAVAIRAFCHHSLDELQFQSCQDQLTGFHRAMDLD